MEVGSMGRFLAGSRSALLRHAALRIAGGAMLAALAMAGPCLAEPVLVGKMTGEQCRARGGVPVDVVPTTGQNPDPVRACFVDAERLQNMGIQPSWLCPDGKTPMSATGGCPG